MSTEAAIIELVVAGSGAFDETNNKIQADLTAMERSSKKAEAGAADAERAAAQAEAAAHKLTHKITGVIHRMHAALGLAERLASVAGGEDSGLGKALGIAGHAITGAGQGARLGSYFGPEGAAIGAGLGGLLGIAQSLKETDKRLQESTEKLANQSGNEITDALLREAGLGKLDNAIARGGRQVQ